MIKILYTCILTCYLTALVIGQACTGSVGQNIFEDGDFGTGSAGVLAPDPMIAPGYNYSFSVPADGEYSIVNHTDAWGTLYPTWISIPDNSPDAEGYMMAVNASFQPGIFYEQEISGLCENTLYEFTADIINLISLQTAGHLKPNVAFLIDGVLEYQTGEVPQSEQWITYGFSFTTPPGKTTVQLTLRNNAPGGIGNDLALDNITFRPCGPSAFVDIEADSTIFLCIDDDPINISANIEDGSSIQYFVQWQSSTDNINWVDMPGVTSQTIVHSQFSPGDYYYRYFSSSNVVNLDNPKCRVLSEVVQITVLPLTFDVSDTICDGNSYEFGSELLTSSGIYSRTTLSSRGCDSVTSLSLEVVPRQNILIDATPVDPTCTGGSNGSIVINSISGVYPPSTILANGSPVFSNLSAGDYVLEVADRYGCDAVLDITLVDPEDFTLSIGQDTTIRLGVTIDLKATSNYPIETIQWTYENGEGCENCVDNEALIYGSSNVIAVGTNAANCQTEASIFVEVDDESSLYMPNVFSPNGDGNNDELILSIFQSSVAELESFVVYDRWGNQLTQMSNIMMPSSGLVLWDGSSSGQDAMNGIYVYKLALRLINGRIVVDTGSVTVMR